MIELVGNCKDVVEVELCVALDSTVFEISLMLLFWLSFGASTMLVLIASDGTFRTDVVVAVLNVTEVFVVKLAGVDETAALFVSFLSLGFSLLIALLRTLSTSSFDSSPRKKLNINSNLDF